MSKVVESTTNDDSNMHITRVERSTGHGLSGLYAPQTWGLGTD